MRLNKHCAMCGRTDGQHIRSVPEVKQLVAVMNLDKWVCLSRRRDKHFAELYRIWRQQTLSVNNKLRTMYIIAYIVYIFLAIVVQQNKWLWWGNVSYEALSPCGEVIQQTNCSWDGRNQFSITTVGEHFYTRPVRKSVHTSNGLKELLSTIFKTLWQLSVIIK